MVDFISLATSLLKDLKPEERAAVSRITFISMQNDKLYRNLFNPQCVYWDESPGQDPHWSTKGCNTSMYVPGEKMFCSCNHLTSFAILMDVKHDISHLLYITSYIGCGISLVCLILTVVIHVCSK
uniref:GAIN-B domain-containing protein n=1 Tax=Octopus bimaculoides TaxID=37653 RepID=A0A0L8HBY6_OCTBM